MHCLSVRLFILLAGTYYTSITNFMQGYIDNEINLNDEQTCGGTCSDYKSTKNHHCQDYTICDHSNFKQTRCTGDIFDCTTIDADGAACLVVCVYSIKFNVHLSPFPCCHFPHFCNVQSSRNLTLVDFDFWAFFRFISSHLISSIPFHFHIRRKMSGKTGAITT